MPENAIEKKPAKTSLSLIENLTPFEAAAFGGDLGKLTPDQRGVFLAKVHQSVGLNPLTGGFQLLNLSGKMVLYATKGVTNQLTRIHNLTISVTPAEVKNGLMTCHATATTPDGRSDTDLGAVPYDDKMPAIDRANAAMKVTTKAKRRVVLSLLGLGMLDESEFDTISSDRVKPVDGNEVPQTHQSEPRQQSTRKPQQPASFQTLKDANPAPQTAPQGTAAPSASPKPFESELRAERDEWIAHFKKTLKDWYATWSPGVTKWADVNHEAVYKNMIAMKNAPPMPDMPAFNADDIDVNTGEVNQQ